MSQEQPYLILQQQQSSMVGHDSAVEYGWPWFKFY
jgi:hypothetical protein